MLYRKREDNKLAFKNNIFKLFTDAVGGDLDEFTEMIYSRFDVECFEYSDDHKYWQVFTYFKEKLIPHKIHVYQAGLELSRQTWFKDFKIDVDQYFDNLWLHDISKFSAIEAFPYATNDFSKKGKGSLQFQIAWNHHKTMNRHHPEQWMNVNRKGDVDVLPMDDIFILEMFADWIGAGRTYGNELETWLPENFKTFKFHYDTKMKVKQIAKQLNIDI